MDLVVAKQCWQGIYLSNHVCKSLSRSCAMLRTDSTLYTIRKMWPSNAGQWIKPLFNYIHACIVLRSPLQGQRLTTPLFNCVHACIVLRSPLQGQKLTTPSFNCVYACIVLRAFLQGQRLTTPLFNYVHACIGLRSFLQGQRLPINPSICNQSVINLWSIRDQSVIKP